MSSGTKGRNSLRRGIGRFRLVCIQHCRGYAMQPLDYRVNAITPVFAVPDVGKTMAWYGEVLGFTADPFPKQPPYAFAILSRSQVQLMLRRLQPGEAQPPPSAGWNAYVRVGNATLLGLWEALKDHPCVIEPLKR